MFSITHARPAGPKPKPLYNDDCIWEDADIAVLDNDWDDFPIVDYIAVGSYDPEPYEAMVMILAIQ